MRKINFWEKKAVAMSLLTVFIICSASIAIPVAQGSMLVNAGLKRNELIKLIKIDKINAKKEYATHLYEIFEFLRESTDDMEYNIMMRALHSLQIYYLKDKLSDPSHFDLEALIENIELQDKETQDKVIDMIEKTSVFIEALDGGNMGENTDDFYRYRTVYAIVDMLLLGLPPSEWIPVSVLVLFIGFLDLLIAIICAATDIVPLSYAVILGTLTGLIPIIYVEVVFRMGAWLTGRSIDMAFLVVNNSTGETIDGLTITAEPVDNSKPYVFPIQNATQKNKPGWYFIPDIHAPMRDVPPGIHHVIINGKVNETSYHYEFDTPGIPMGERYGQTIAIDPIT